MKVDVLEFFDWMGDEIPYTNKDNTAKFHAARAAIAELIEADRAFDAARMLVTVECFSLESALVLEAAEDRRTSALAKVQQ